MKKGKKKVNGAVQTEEGKTILNQDPHRKNRRGTKVRIGKVVKVPAMTKEKAIERLQMGKVTPDSKEWKKFLNRGWFTVDEMNHLGGYNE